MASIAPPDLEAWLIAWLRPRITDVPGLQFGNKIPNQYDGSYPLIVVRDDSGAKLSPVTFDRSVGVTVYMGSRQVDKPSRDLAARVFALMTDDPGMLYGFASGSPIIGISDEGCTGPYPINDTIPTASFYCTFEYTVTSW
ncbi:MAG: hypothetical protein ABF966_10555 [Bifidobacterium psychraerophilum]|uniref:hypothetical protein n=1 Tax=Bifidobacterium psychraerophilum TaxID=218140 RepID=UPI0039E88B9D